MRFRETRIGTPESDEFDHMERPRRRKLWVIVLAAAAVLIVVAGAGAFTYLGHDTPATNSDAVNAAGSPGVTGESGDAGGSAGLGAGASASASTGPSASARPSATGTKAGSTGSGPGAPPIAAAAGKRWTLGYSEEFNGTSLDKSKLSPCFDWNSGDCTSTFNEGREHYQPSQVVVSGGTAKLIAAPLSPAYPSSACQNGSCTYKAGLVSTSRPNASDGSKYLYSFTYGYVESRFKFPVARGFFTAFWMLPTDPTYNYKTEIDILEQLGNEPSTMFMTYHYNNRDTAFSGNKGMYNNGKCPVKDYSKDFVRMGLDWQPDHIAWYIDGVECARFTDAANIAKDPMQIILHLMVDNNWQRRSGAGLADPTLTRQLEVDYIRVYQQTAA
ncbi:glycoside hydrolase family 16 protein [Dactylosporangium sp. CA-233914]|uniref:glycoside hydrolase family 16 protein n=1 Tax=Dactylosporangium sp. CA-233914 TaxID=3239934 RepID=UPI003D8F626B